MTNCNCKEFQAQVDRNLLRHRSVLDIMTKLDEFNARTNRAVVKSVTNCGCISINAQKQNFKALSYEDLKNQISSHLSGDICDTCRDVLEEEIGSYIFYLAGLCNSLNLDLSEIIKKELDRTKTLGLFNLK